MNHFLNSQWQSCAQLLLIITLYHQQLYLESRNTSVSNFKASVEHSFKFCEILKSRLFKKDDIQLSARAYKEFVQLLPLFIESEHKQYATRNIEMPGVRPGRRSEQEYGYGHNRFNLLGPVGPNCSLPLQKFGKYDEEKHICGLDEIQKISNQNECVIYSIGSNNQWGFEIDILTKTSCRVETFDCTVKGIIPFPYNETHKHRIRFHKICLGSKNEQIKLRGNAYRTYMDWSTLNKYLNMTTDPTFLKMDIEPFALGPRGPDSN